MTSIGVSRVEGPGTGAQIVQVTETRSARIESVRALAALSVLLSHAFLFSYGLTPTITEGFAHRAALEAGFGGVEVFFALSGYLLFWPFARSAFQTGERVDLRRYALNRAVRILPLYYVVLAVLLIVQHHGGSFGQWWRFGLFLENFSPSTINTVDVPMWSLAIEVQFYLLLPLLAMLIARLSGRSIGRAAGLLAALALASIALRQAVVWHSNPPLFRWQYSLPSVFFFFVAGMSLALLRVRWLERRPRWLDGPAGRSDVWLACTLPLWALVCWRLSYEPAAALAGFLIVGACALPLRDGLFARLTEWKPLARLGVASYSLYLWHVPVLLVIAGGDLAARHGPHLIPTTGRFLVLLAPGGVICSIVALGSYALIEAPPLHLRRRWARSLPPAAR